MIPDESVFPAECNGVLCDHCVPYGCGDPDLYRKFKELHRMRVEVIRVSPIQWVLGCTLREDIKPHTPPNESDPEADVALQASGHVSTQEAE